MVFYLRIFIVLAAFAWSSCSNSSKLTPTAYNDSLVTQQIKVVEAAEKLQEVLDTYVKEDMETIYERLRGQINLSKAKTEGFGDFNDNKSFKEATLGFISTYQQLTENEYKEALSLLSKPDSLYSKTDEARVELLYKEIDQKTAPGNGKYRLAQDAFAKENNIKFSEPKKMSNDEHLRYPIGRFSNLESYEIADTKKHIEQIEALPHHLLKVLEQLSEEELSKPYRPGGWTGNQVVHHMADSHLNCLIRLKLTLTEDNPTIKPYFEERWAELSDYSLPIESAIDLLRATHFKLGHLLKGLKDEDFKRTYVHPQYQYQRDISYLTALYAWHGSHHVGHLKLLKNS